MIHLAGSESFAVPPSELFVHLADAGFLARCLPEAAIASATPDRAEWSVKPKIAFLAGSLETIATVTERVPASRVQYSLVTRGIGSGSTVEAGLSLRADGAGSMVDWSAKISAVSGLLKLAPKGLLQTTAEKVIAEVWAAIRANLAD
jgi:carbon monoxide dehydrogenase subunit G